ncbi:hypothetical protein [Neisseria chenwenguii]|nr:hypothetical protein [Neisseria chenwenguii]
MLLLSVTVAAAAVAMAMKHLFPGKDMFYWQMAVSMLITIILIRLFR